MRAPALHSPTVIDAMNFATAEEPIEWDPKHLLDEIIVPLVQGLRDAVRIIAQYLDERDEARTVGDPQQ